MGGAWLLEARCRINQNTPDEADETPIRLIDGAHVALDQAVLEAFLPSAACAAASRAIGTRKGEQET
jgi:hypothetical protein